MDNNKLYKLLSTEGYGGFKLDTTHFVSELDCDMWIMHHEESGASMIYIDSHDEEKTFSLSFRLSPRDDTGVDHIIEHTLLCGSDRYKVKDWGGDGLLSSYHGAFTMRESSMYPVSSPDEASFQELVRIYTDAVFSPLALHSDLPMKQEGWHYRYDRETDKLSYGGIVYNEMRASYEMPEFILADAQVRTAFPDTSLAFNAGGDPASIPALTYDGFLREYRRIFTADNCLGYVYGKTELSNILDILGENLLKAGRSGKAIRIEGVPSAVKGHTRTEYYPLTDKNTSAARDFISFHWIIPQDRKTVVYARVLTNLIRQRLLSLVPDSMSTLECLTDLYWPMINFVLRNVREDRLEEISDLLSDRLRELADKGFSDEEIKVAVAMTRFAFDRALIFIPRGVDIGIKVTTGWAHYRSPWDLLEYTSILDRLEAEETPSAIFTSMIKQLLIDNPQFTRLILKADPELSEKRRQNETERLSSARKEMRSDDISRIIKEEQELSAYQNSPDKKEYLDALPKTKPETLSASAPVLYPREVETSSGKLLFLPADSSSAVMTLYYDLSSLRKEEIVNLGIFSQIFGHTGTETMDFDTTRLAISTYTDDLYFSTVVNGRDDRLYGKIQWKFLPKHIVNSQELVQNMLCHGDYSQKDRIYEILNRYLQSRAQAKVDTSNRVKARWSSAAYLMQFFSGPEFADALNHILTRFDECWPKLREDMQKIAQKLFDAPASLVSLWCSIDNLQSIKDKLLFKAGNFPQTRFSETLPEGNELFACDDSMYFMSYGGPVAERTAPLLVSVSLARGFASRRIRDIAGAYTVSVLLSPENDLVMSTGRDPNLGATLESFAQIPDYLTSVTAEEVSSAIIAAASDFYKKNSPGIFGDQNSRSGENKCDLAVKNYINGMTPEKQQQLWDALKSVSPADIRNCIPVWNSVLNKKYCCAIASPAAPGAEEWFHN